MAYLIPTEDPDFVYPDRYKMPHPRHPKYYERAGEPRFKSGDLVVFNHGIYMVRYAELRTAKHGKGKGCYLYGIGKGSPVAENNLTEVTDELLNDLNLTRNENHQPTRED